MAFCAAYALALDAYSLGSPALQELLLRASVFCHQIHLLGQTSLNSDPGNWSQAWARQGLLEVPVHKGFLHVMRQEGIENTTFRVHFWEKESVSVLSPSSGGKVWRDLPCEEHTGVTVGGHHSAPEDGSPRLWLYSGAVSCVLLSMSPAWDSSSLPLNECWRFLKGYLFKVFPNDCLEFPAGSVVKNLPANAGDLQVRSLGQEDPLQEDMAAHSSTLA